MSNEKVDVTFTNSMERSENKTTERLKKVLKREYIDIESRTDIPDDQKISKIIKVTASVCAGIAVQPIPFADIFILTPIQAYMGTRIAAVRGVPVKENEAVDTIKEISGAIGLGLLAQQLAIGAYKTGLPFLGGLMTIPLVFGLTYGIGRVMDAYFVSKYKKESIRPEKLKEIWKKGRKEGKSLANEKEIKEHAKEINLSESTVNFVKTNFDEIAIMVSLQSIKDSLGATETDQAVLAAFKRYSKETQDMDSVRDYLNGMSDDQIGGVISNVKGILHEMEFVRFENSNGDSVTAAMFPETNHQGFDVVLTDEKTGQSWETQLKTTDSANYVQEWMSKHPDGEILISEEIASELNLSSSGFSNEELTVRVETFVDGLVSTDADASVWGLFPTLTLLSVSFVVIELYRRFRSGEITQEQFRSISLRTTGIKAGKFGILLAALSIPGLNIVVGAGLVAKVVYSLTSSKFLAIDWIHKEQNI